MYLMERYALVGAHYIFAQSESMASLYGLAYGLPGEQFLIAPPPMARILEPMLGGERWGGGPRALPRGGDGSASTSASSSASGGGSDTYLPTFSLLVYGRVGYMKGSETVAEAVALVRAGLPQETALEVVYVGIEWPCSLHGGKSTAQCVMDIVKRSTGEGDAVSIELRGPVERGELPGLVAGFHGAIVASEFETFNLAAHELAACGLPLVVSRIAALEEFFGEHNAYPFPAGDAGGLAAAALSLFGDTLAGVPRVARLAYGDATAPYRAVAAAARRDPGGTAAQRGNGELATIDYSIGILSRDCFASRSCKELWEGGDTKGGGANSTAG